MKRSTKTISLILVFFLIIAIVIVGRTMVGNHFKKKFSKRPPPGIMVTEVIEKEENYNRFELENVIKWRKKYATKRYNKIVTEKKLRTELEVWNEETINKIDIIRLFLLHINYATND